MALALLPDDEDTVLSLDDVLEEDRELEDTANAVLGDSEDSDCSYSKGYIGRQALYSCATCCKGGEREAGVCLACSLHCHEGHELFELYTKRNFRCDCGNSKFPDFSCSLKPDKDAVNELNKYGHNFRGLYCTCDRPYPDPEDETPDEMVQCIICEDWFHSRHLNTEAPPDYEEMACDECMKSRDFLRYYMLRMAPVKLSNESEAEPSFSLVEVVQNEGKDVEKTERKENLGRENLEAQPGHFSSINASTNEPTSTSEIDERVSSNVCARSTSVVCVLQQRRKSVDTTNPSVSAGKEGGAGFFSSKWRQELCKCCECMAQYKSSECVFLLDDEDSLMAYEQRAQPRPQSHDAAFQAMSSSMGRVEQVEAITHYNELKSELANFLKGFAESKKVVSKRDIDQFFEGMTERKRQKLDNQDGVPPASCHF